jgi:hypothetical protein
MTGHARDELLKDSDLESLNHYDGKSGKNRMVLNREAFEAFGATVHKKGYGHFYITTPSEAIHEMSSKNWKERQQKEKTELETLAERIKHLENGRSRTRFWNITALVVSIVCAFGAAWFKDYLSETSPVAQSSETRHDSTSMIKDTLNKSYPIDTKWSLNYFGMREATLL